MQKFNSRITWKEALGYAILTGVTVATWAGVYLHGPGTQWDTYKEKKAFTDYKHIDMDHDGATDTDDPDHFPIIYHSFLIGAADYSKGIFSPKHLPDAVAKPASWNWGLLPEASATPSKEFGAFSGDLEAGSVPMELPDVDPVQYAAPIGITASAGIAAAFIINKRGGKK